MKTTELIATNLHQVYFGGNWTASNLKTTLEDVTLKMASKQVYEFNTILTLTYHIHYYLKGTLEAINTGELTIRDKYSFDHPNLETEDDWQAFLNTMWEEAKTFIDVIKSLDDSVLDTYLAQEKYGKYHRNLLGIIEHTHYHLGQIVIIKKLLSVV